MPVDEQRVGLMRSLLAAQGYDGIIVRSPSNVLMLSGYAPVLGDSYCFFRQSGEVTLIVPECEADLAAESWAKEVRTYPPTTDGRPDTASELALPILRELLGDYTRDHKLGYESGPSTVPASYSQIGYPDRASAQVLKVAGHRAVWYDCTDLTETGQMWKSPKELEQVRKAVAVADLALESARDEVNAGKTEHAIRAAVTASVLRDGPNRSGVARVDAFVHVVSGPRTAAAHALFNLTGDRNVEPGDPVMVQIEVGVGGFWVETSRTFFAGTPTATVEVAYRACLAAREAGHRSVENGILGSDVDSAVRASFEQAGLLDGVKRATGHGVGFQAISPLGRPQLSYDSIDAIRPHQVFTIAPGYYSTEFGVRLSDVVAFLPRGFSVLTTAPVSLDAVTVG